MFPGGSLILNTFKEEESSKRGGGGLIEKGSLQCNLIENAQLGAHFWNFFYEIIPDL